MELVEIETAGMCCGSAGIYNLLQPAPRRELGERKAHAILAAEPDIVATANPGCAVQLPAALRRAGHRDLPIVHPAELVAPALSLGVAEREAAARSSAPTMTPTHSPGMPRPFTPRTMTRAVAIPPAMIHIAALPALMRG